MFLLFPSLKFEVFAPSLKFEVSVISQNFSFEYCHMVALECQILLSFL